MLFGRGKLGERGYVQSVFPLCRKSKVRKCDLVPFYLLGSGGLFLFCFKWWNKCPLNVQMLEKNQDRTLSLSLVFKNLWEFLCLAWLMEDCETGNEQKVETGALIQLREFSDTSDLPLHPLLLWYQRPSINYPLQIFMDEIIFQIKLVDSFVSPPCHP